MLDKAISNTSPLLYLHRCGGLAWLPRLFTLVCVPGAVTFELAEGRSRGFDVPNPEDHSWMKITDPQAMPSEWFAADLGAGEIAAMSLALEHTPITFFSWMTLWQEERLSQRDSRFGVLCGYCWKPSHPVWSKASIR